jgi:hypothetical protein
MGVTARELEAHMEAARRRHQELKARKIRLDEQTQGVEKYNPTQFSNHEPGILLNEVLLVIFGFVPSAQILGTCARVCKHWHQATLSNQLWKLKIMEEHQNDMLLLLSLQVKDPSPLQFLRAYWLGTFCKTNFLSAFSKSKKYTHAKRIFLQ